MGNRGSSSGMKSGSKLLNAINSINTNPIPRVSAETEKLALDYWKKLDWVTKRDATIQEVPMGEVRAWQGYIRQSTLRDIATGSSEYRSSSDVPQGLRINGQVVIMDGNHRAAVSYLRGDKSLKVRVVDYVPRRRR